jgi:hypothetical protein
MSSLTTYELSVYHLWYAYHWFRIVDLRKTLKNINCSAHDLGEYVEKRRIKMMHYVNQYEI